MAKNNIIVKLQRWMDSKAGQMFLNYAYSWGASIVILGALFKITHIDGADFMLFLGMGTEVIVFFLAGFERPYDVDNKKEGTANTELAGGEPATIGGGGGTFIVGGGIPGATGGSGESVIVEGGESGEAAAISGSGVSGGGSGVPGGGTIILGGGGGGSGVPGGGTIIIGGGGGGSGVPSSGSGQPVGAPVVAPIAASGENAQPTENAQSIDPAQLAGAIAASPIVASPQFTGMCPEMQEATQTYVDQLNELTDILTKQQVGESCKPIIFMNTAKYWDFLGQVMTHMDHEGFIESMDDYNIIVVNTPEELIRKLLDDDNHVTTCRAL